MKTPKSAVQSTAQLPFQENQNLVSLKDNKPVTTSLQIATYFEKMHKNVLQDIRSLECSSKFIELNFQLSFYNRQLANGGCKKEPMYYITRDGFTFLVMGFTGKVAAKFKEDYINAFNEMEKTLKEDVVSKKELLAAQEQVAIWRKTANSALESNKSMTMLIRDLSKELLNELSNEKEVSDSVLRPKTFHKLTSEYYNCAINSFAEWLKCENTSCYASDVRDNRLVKKLEATRLLYNDPKRTIPISIALKP